MISTQRTHTHTLWCLRSRSKKNINKLAEVSGSRWTHLQISVIVTPGETAWARVKEKGRGSIGWKLFTSQHSRRCSCLYYCAQPSREAGLTRRAESSVQGGEELPGRKRGSFFRLLFELWADYPHKSTISWLLMPVFLESQQWISKVLSAPEPPNLSLVNPRLTPKISCHRAGNLPRHINSLSPLYWSPPRPLLRQSRAKWVVWFRWDTMTDHHSSQQGWGGKRRNSQVADKFCNCCLSKASIGGVRKQQACQGI